MQETAVYLYMFHTNMFFVFSLCSAFLCSVSGGEGADMNYVFDLYGTLIDIKTDEADPRLWKSLADIYRRYGAFYTPTGLRSSFLKIEASMRAKTAARLGTSFPEIKLEHVFGKLYMDAENSVSAEEHTNNMETWLFGIANTFRAMSIRKIRLFPGAQCLLKSLRKKGNHVYLLSNAQAIFTIPEIEYLGLSSMFDAIFLSSDHDLCKPDPRFLDKLILQQGLDKSETIMVGNEPRADMGMAALCGVHGILLNSCGLKPDVVKAQITETAGERAESFLADMSTIDTLRDLCPNMPC